MIFGGPVRLKNFRAVNKPILNIRSYHAAPRVALAAQAWHTITGHVVPSTITIGPYRAWAVPKTRDSCQAVRPWAFWPSIFIMYPKVEIPVASFPGLNIVSVWTV